MAGKRYTHSAAVLLLFAFAVCLAARAGAESPPIVTSEEAAQLIAKLNENAEGAIWAHAAWGYFKRNPKATLNEAGEVEISYEQCIIWGSDVGSTVEEKMSRCGTGHFQWKPTRFAIDPSLVDPVAIKTVSGDPKVDETGRRVVFNCSERLMGCARRVEGTEGKADFGMLCTDWRACGDSGANITRLVEIAKGGGS